MKTHHLILLTTALFIVLFYDEYLGLNFGILGLVYAVLLFFNTPKIRNSKTFSIVFVLQILSSFAFAWYGDFVSFLAIVFSMSLLAFLSKNKELKPIFVIPVFAINFVTFIYRIFQLQQWLPKFNTNGATQKVLSVVVIPIIFVVAFFGIYTLGSNHFANLLTFEWNFNLWQFLVLGAFGFFIAFTIWNFNIPSFLYHQNHLMKNDFLQEDKIARPTWSFLDIDAERKSGIISLVLLNLMLFFFIITFNYEQFYELQKTPNQLSVETHERVNAVILSIVMAIVVILFYFKSNFNFDEKVKPLKILAKIWIFLNAILVFSAVAKNAEYVLNLGLTYKRLGVFTFLTLALIGLFFTFVKIQKSKTNAYLFNKMVWYFYATILVCSFINWGGISTQYNINNDKGNLDYLKTLNFNHKILEEHYGKGVVEEQAIDYDYENYLERETWLSSILYYENLKN